MLNPTTIAENKKMQRLNYGDLLPQKHCEWLGVQLSKVLNTTGIKQMAFGSRLLWEYLAGRSCGKILQQIVFAHQATPDGKNKLKCWDGDRFWFWHYARQFAEELNLSISTVGRHIKKLQAIGFITYKIKQNDFGRPCYHLALNYAFFFARLKDIAIRTGYKMTISKLPDCQLSSYIYKFLKKENNTEENSFFETDINTKTAIANESVKPIEKQNLSLPSQKDPEDKDLGNVEQKINKNKNTMHKPQVRTRPSVAREDATPELGSGARVVRSALGMSAFKSIEQMQECQKQLTLYFARKEASDKAAEKAFWAIDAETKGKRSLYVQDFLDGLPIGSWCKKEWEVAPGEIAPVFRAYLRFKLKRNGDTKEQANQKADWYLKQEQSVTESWVECKRIIDLEKPRLQKAIALGQNLLALKIPEWIIEVFRPEIPIEEVTGTAEVLGEIATQYSVTVATQQSEKDVPKLENSHPIKKMLGKLGVLESDETPRRRKAQGNPKGLALYHKGTMCGAVSFRTHRAHQESDRSSEDYKLPGQVAYTPSPKPEKIISKEDWEAIKAKSPFFQKLKKKSGNARLGK